jgi:hypothetical protein
MTEAPNLPATPDRDDPSGLIAEAYRIAGIGPTECRSIFVDWALKTDDPAAAAVRLLALHGPAHPEHPMTALLREARGAPPAPRRRGGRAGRRG